jgi:hypothetical protein
LICLKLFSTINLRFLLLLFTFLSLFFHSFPPLHYLSLLLKKPCYILSNLLSRSKDYLSSGMQCLPKPTLPLASSYVAEARDTACLHCLIRGGLERGTLCLENSGVFSAATRMLYSSLAYLVLASKSVNCTKCKKDRRKCRQARRLSWFMIAVLNKIAPSRVPCRGSRDPCSVCQVLQAG